MKISSIILCCFLIINCSSNLNSNSNHDNQKEIDLIDKMAFSKVFTKVEIDSLDQIIDTLYIKKYKLDNNQNNRYEEVIYQKMIAKSYYKLDKDLFYQIRTSEKEGILSIFETQSNSKGLVEKAFQTNNERPKVDTTIMDYSYDFYRNGKKKQMIIKLTDPEVDPMISTLNYDRNENPINGLMMLKKDTFSHQTWEYSNQNLVKSTFTYHIINPSKSVWYYDANENLIKEEAFSKKDSIFEKRTITQNIYNASNEKIKSIEENIITGKKSYFKYIKEE